MSYRFGAGSAGVFCVCEAVGGATQVRAVGAEDLQAGMGVSHGFFPKLVLQRVAQ